MVNTAIQLEDNRRWDEVVSLRERWFRVRDRGDVAVGTRQQALSDFRAAVDSYRAWLYVNREDPT